ncbi:MAG TPA: ABC transporter substrate-binding protein [Phycisphaerae bacterium]|nr:ABC transporter substrate-binding protein [Phycisphaerae bacterium]HNU44125.1 ABC transporter substrate-binding protein [Phycisphaerae bacterium]
MQRRVRLGLLIVLGLSGFAAVGACRRETPAAPEDTSATPSPSPASRPLTVAFVQVGAESAWRTAETRSIQTEAGKRPGIELKFFDAQQKQENQIRGLKSFVAQDVDVIVLAPVVETGWEPALREAKEAGIPVVLVDRGVNVTDESLYTTLIASDFVEEGRIAGRWLAEKTGGKCSIVELQGTVGAAPAIDRKKGFEEIIAQHPEMKIIKSQSGDFTRAGGKQVMEAFIKAEGRNIQAVYAHNDDMAIGAIQALKDAGMKPGQDVLVISIDAVRAAFEAMIAGELNATVECSPLFGPLLFDTIAKIVAGEPVPKKIINQDRLFEPHEAAALIDSREY